MRIVVPSFKPIVIRSLPPWSTSNGCPPSGWCRRVMVTSSGVLRRMYLVRVGLPVGQDAALEVLAEGLLDEAGIAEPVLGAVAGVL